MNEYDIDAFWNANPCGDFQVGGLANRHGNYEAFFNDYDNFRYTHEKHILSCLDAIDFEGKRVLEVGLGQGADSEQMIRRGAIWSGLDLTAESIDRVGTRLALRELPHASLKQGSVTEIPFEQGSFDIVFSHGVLHHVPDVTRASQEIHRVLQPDGELIVMLYARWSLNYLLAISIVRRLGLLALYLTNRRPDGILGQHVELARDAGLRNYLKMENFIHRNTDGPLNPYSKVYDLSAVSQDFPDFEIVRHYRKFMHAPPLPVRWLPLAGSLGWHLWVHLRPKQT